MAATNKNSEINPFQNIMGQSQVSRFLAEAQRENRLSHAYLFVGPVGSGKTEAAVALAKAFICESGGCGQCDECRRVQRQTHPDVYWVEPEGSANYLIEQIRQVNNDAMRAPVRANHKVFIITRADLLGSHAANAFLKTLEEPLANTSFILMSRSRDSVLPTIASRCQTLMFRRLPQEESIGLVCRHTGCSKQDAAIALATTGGVVRKACEFINSPSKRNVRLVVIDALERLQQMDSADVIEAAKKILNAIEATSGELKSKYEQDTQVNSDFMSKGALNYLEKQHKRKLNSSTREGLGEAFSAIRSWLYDCETVKIGSGGSIVNDDCHYIIELTGCNVQLRSLVWAQEAVNAAENKISHNVTPQLVVETMLFDIRKALYDSSSAN